jgi:hypothetical protein
MMALRAKALENFGEKVILPNTPMSEIENKLVPLYLGHRYQVEAAAKVIGGLNYRYALRGDGQPIAEMIAPEEQRRAINALLETIKPETLTLPERLLKLMPPPAIGYPRTRESFRGRTGLTFDALAPVEAAAGLTFSMLLHPERASRLVQHNARDSKNPSLESLLDTLSRRTILAPPLSGMPGQTQQATGISYLYHLMALANDARCAPAARAIAYKEIVRIGSLAEPWIQSQVKLFQEDPKQLPLPRPLEAPPGMPIGDHEDGVLPLW